MTGSDNAASTRHTHANQHTRSTLGAAVPADHTTPHSALIEFDTIPYRFDHVDFHTGSQESISFLRSSHKSSATTATCGVRWARGAAAVLSHTADSSLLRATLLYPCLVCMEPDGTRCPLVDGRARAPAITLHAARSQSLSTDRRERPDSCGRPLPVTTAAARHTRCVAMP